ncbi:hypothetical protein D3C80_1636190 [compost metagenome]
MLILDRTLVSHGDILAHLARRLDRLLDRLHGDHFGIGRRTIHQAVGSHRATRCDANCAQHGTDEHRLVHINLLASFFIRAYGLLPALERKISQKVPTTRRDATYKKELPP